MAGNAPMSLPVEYVTLFCECNDWQCRLRITVPIEVGLRRTDPGLAILSKDCEHGPEAGETLVEEKGGYRIYAVKGTK